MSENSITKGRILVVDDDDATRRGFQAILETAGYTVVVESGGQAALDRLTKSRESAEPDFDLMLLDLVMPGLNGLGVMRELRKLHDFLPVAFVSGRLDSKICVEAAHYGVVDFLAKPAPAKRLCALVEQMLGEEREFGAHGEADSLQRLAEHLVAFAKTLMRRHLFKPAAAALDCAIELSKSGVSPESAVGTATLRMIAHHLIAIQADAKPGADFASARFYKAARLLEDLV
ncbi:MAG: DNA-binding NtrC family response regulator [Verrucomicrobiales bacterium]|jgi:DNA-binding NtrC family response regulator